MQTERNDLLALSQQELLAELVLELRQTTEAVETLQDITADIYTLQKEMAWDRQPW